MPVPLKVVDPGKMLSPDLAEHIRERTQKLEHFFGSIRRCRVTIDGPGQHALRGRVRVRISVIVPDTEIAINRQTGADLPIAIREAFDAADRRVEDYARLSRRSGQERRRARRDR